MTSVREAFPQAAAVAVTILEEPAVAAAWDKPSALPEFTVRGLAGHLAAQVFRVPEVLAAPPLDEEPITLMEHYARVEWVDADVNADINVVIRQSSEDVAAVGASALTARVRDVADGLPDLLAAEPADRVVHLPWGPWSLALDDFLVTRMMEVAVHADDLAVSVGTTTPPLPAAVLDPVVDLLSRLAVRRHGPTAVLRALSRAERAPASIVAF